MHIRCVAFDCFGTLFAMDGVSREQIADYVNHVRSGVFEPYQFPAEWWQIEAHSDVASGIQQIKGLGITVVALSNGSVDLLQGVASRAGFEFDHVVDLVAHQVYKPHRDAYLTVQKDLGILPAETLMVTANPTFGDIEGAESVGMPSQVIRHGQPHNVIELAEMIAAGHDFSLRNLSKS